MLESQNRSLQKSLSSSYPMRDGRSLLTLDTVPSSCPNSGLTPLIFMTDTLICVFSVPWVKTFSLCLNALDNVKARNHVNRLCIAADVPLVESGTAGYMGEISLIKKGLSQCYECQVTND